MAGSSAPIDPFQVRYAARLASGLGARVVMPDYPLTPEHTWRDAHEPIVDLVDAAAAARRTDVVIAGDSAGGGLALAVALTLRDRGGPQPSRLLLISPWVDLTISTPETYEVTRDDPWLFIGKMQAYAEWWAGSPDDLGRPEVSPGARRPGRAAAGADVLRHPRLARTRVAGCWPAARREAGWPLTSIEEPGLIHVYPILPFLPEAGRAWRQTLEFLR